MIPLPDCRILRVDARAPADARALQRAAGSRLVRLARGVYVPATEWARLDDRERHVVRVVALLPAPGSGIALFSESALVAHGVRLLGPAPDRIAVIDPAARVVDRRGKCVVRHPTGSARLTRVAVGPYAVDAADLPSLAVWAARSLSFRSAVVVLDQLLRAGVDRAACRRVIETGPVRNARRAKDALDFADGRSDSVWESSVRVVFREVGAPTPVLQQEFRSPDGPVARVDFWFPDQGVVVEFDGRAKYTDPSLRRGRTAEQVVFDEKRREDRVRAAPDVTGFVRLTAEDARSPAFVAARLRAAGVPARW